MTDEFPSSPINIAESSGPDPRRWFALVVIAIAQLMVVLDASIVNIALPKAAEALNIARSDWQWAVTAYTITFGGFLLLGGRIADYLGRKRAFLIGLVGFATASLIGGFAQNQQMLFGSRALQGLFAALLAPAALSLISVTFSDSKERAKAFGVYGALSGVGAAIGLIAGGLLTEYASWRWCFFVNTPMAMIAFFLAIPNVRESRVKGHPKFDVPGALLATSGMMLIVLGVNQAAKQSWGSVESWPFLAIGAVLLVFFFLLEATTSHPLLPLRLITDRLRAGAYLSQLFVAFGLFGMFFFMTFYFQTVHNYSSAKSGLLFIPFSLGVIVSAGATTRLLPRFGPRPVASIGMTVAAVGLFYLSRIEVDSSYVTHVLPAMVTMSLGLGATFVSLSSTALFNVAHNDTGAASAVLNTTQQVGGSFGTAVQSTIAFSAFSAYIAGHTTGAPTTAQVNAASVAGYQDAFRFGSVMIFIGACIFFFMVNVDRHHLGQNDAVREEAQSAV